MFTLTTHQSLRWSIIQQTSTEAELFTIRCGINQAVQLLNIEQIIVITDSIHIAEKVFGSSVHSYKIQIASISMEIRQFFKRNDHNSLKFWDCPSKDNWSLYKVMGKETKNFNLTLLFPCKSSWQLSWKNECDKLINK